MGEIKKKYAIDSNMCRAFSTRGFGLISTVSLYGNLYFFSNKLKTVIYSVLTGGLLFYFCDRMTFNGYVLNSLHKALTYNMSSLFTCLKFFNVFPFKFHTNAKCLSFPHFLKKLFFPRGSNPGCH